MRSSYLILIFAISLSTLKLITDLTIPALENATHISVTDRNGFEIRDTKNSKGYTKLHEMPSTLIESFIMLEDKFFMEHHGINYKAKLKALYNYFLPHSKKYGASTISEQVVRIIHPRERNLYSKLLEFIEAHILEYKYSKSQILEYYLNSVPYTNNVSGVANASQFYFARDVSTLNVKEQIALAFIVRSPARLSRDFSSIAFNTKLDSISSDLGKGSSSNLIKTTYKQPSNYYNYHYLKYLQSNGKLSHTTSTSLDLAVQKKVYTLLTKRLSQLKGHDVSNIAAIVLDNKTGEIITYISTGLDCEKNQNTGCYIDFVQAKRQAGSTLKPFAYAMAIQNGWRDNTILHDTPFSEFAGNGAHEFHNYSHKYYGDVTLRNALGNSLNIPAIHAINYIGVENFYSLLKELGIYSLTNTPEFYGTGLVLGNGEIKLIELAGAYMILARSGLDINGKQVIDKNSADLITNILSDKNARKLEFSRAYFMNIDANTAVKTGTSTGHRDAWAAAYDSHYTIAIWMGNADRTPMKEITGSNGAAPLLSPIFHILRSSYTPKAFQKYTFHKDDVLEAELATKIISPLDNQKIATDPRIPITHQAIELRLTDNKNLLHIDWYIDDEKVERLWFLKKGTHNAKAYVITADMNEITLTSQFFVK